MRNLKHFLILVFIFTSCIYKPGIKDYGLQVKLTGRSKAADNYNIKNTAEGVIIDVLSPSGIGSLSITAPGDKWPPRMIIRLHLQALEGFTAKIGEKKFDYILKREENNYRFKQAGQGKKLKPIDVEIPKEFLINSQGELKIKWIDRYRN